MGDISFYIALFGSCALVLILIVVYSAAEWLRMRRQSAADLEKRKAAARRKVAERLQGKYLVRDGAREYFAREIVESIATDLVDDGCLDDVLT